MPEPQIILIENFIEKPNELFVAIRDTIIWDERIKARKTASFGVAYNYSGITYPQTEMLSELVPVCKKIETYIGFMPNNCLINYYLDGNSSMGYYSDSSEELKPGTSVVIISLGAERYISYRSKADQEIKYKYLLKNGSLLAMDKEVQDEWMHAIPKEVSTEQRISLTFRYIIK
ncbi:MAG: alpha-ketoglutarate-dependent dioxygenase AlkB [Cyanosarcina radialis HA8281-LM2]|jgi:alkylated DNA repair dioxygenase AlkB|nr:alpha-ketoglutarate-dependent dioxygenase AlkB [Cyanosarcina radialis HA8281-LM2]